MAGSLWMTGFANDLALVWIDVERQRGCIYLYFAGYSCNESAGTDRLSAAEKNILWLVVSELDAGLFVSVRESPALRIFLAVRRVCFNCRNSCRLCIIDIFDFVQRGEKLEPSIGLESVRNRFWRGTGIYQQYLGLKSALYSSDDSLFALFVA